MHRAVRVLICAAAMLAPALASAQAYPSKPVRIIVPFPAGGPSDLFGRALAHSMSASLGQPVIVENKSGAGGVIGVDTVAKAPPDGYLLVLNSSSTVAIAPFSWEKMPYDAKKDLAPITMVVKVPEVLVVHPSVPVNTLAELIAYAKANPGKVNFGSAGGGTITHLAGELLKTETGINIVHVPYKGAAPAVQDLLAGQVQMGVFDVPVLLSHIKSGKLKALAVTSGARAQALPDVPTTAELGLPKVNSDNWYGLVAPAGTPADVLAKLNASATAALRSPEVLEQYAKVAGIASPSTPVEYAAFIDAEQAKWGPVVKAIGFKQQ